MEPFRDLNNLFLYPELPSCALTFAGALLEDTVPGYTTLNVTGRETISDDLSTTGSIPGRDGTHVIARALPARVLGIEYRLTAPDAQQLQEAFRELRAVLDAPGKITFADDPGIAYFGQLSDMSEVPPYTNDLIGTFAIFCADPYKYETNAKTHTGNPKAIPQPSPYAVPPDEVKVTLATAAAGAAIKNITTGRQIILTGAFLAGDIIRFTPQAANLALRLTVNGQAAMARLDYLASDFGAFTISSGDTIQVTPADATVSVTLRGRWK